MNLLDNNHISEQTKEILKKYDVSFVFQPIFSRYNTIAAYEALMRPKDKNILDFIDEMKKNDKLHELEILSFFGATHAYKKRGYDVILSINSFPTEVFSAEELIEYTECFEMPRKKVIVELLEYSNTKDWTWKAKNEQISFNSGVMVALDDYGTGFNDEEAVEFYKPQMIKIDRSLITNIDREEEKQAYIKELTVKMHKRKIMVLAEGIETKEEFDFLKMIGVDYFQGFYLGRPM